MSDNKFTPEKLLEFLTTKYSHLNDNATKAQEVYELILSKQVRR